MRQASRLCFSVVNFTMPPAQVFDASTTGSAEIVLHKNDILNVLACLGCVYPKDEREVSEQEAPAEHLGISVEDMASGRITVGIARKIVEKHPQRCAKDIEGEAFESLYKALCSAQELKSDAGRTVVAPFAFVSVLAGAYLALDMVRRLHGDEKPEAYTNEWRVNPWHTPFEFNRYQRARLGECECCGRPSLQMVAERLWSPADNPEAAITSQNRFRVA